MREWCGCGAAVRGRRRDVLRWRKAHHCPSKGAPPDEVQVPPTGAESRVEQAWQPIGFVPDTF